MGLGKWLLKATLTGGVSMASPKSGVTRKGQLGRANKQAKKQTKALERIERQGRR